METLKILITGVSGFIGSNIARSLADKNYEIYGLTRGNKFNWRLNGMEDKITLVTCDIGLFENLRRNVEKIKPDGIIHCAQFGAYPYEKDIQQMFNTNLRGIVNLLEISSEFNINWLINCGTSFEYSGSSERISEDAQTYPNSYYGIFKAASTNLMMMYSKTQKSKLLTLIIFQAYGPFEPNGRLAPYILYNLIKNADIKLNNPYLERDFIYIGDIATAFEKSIKVVDNLEKFEIFNIGSGVSTSIRDFADIAKKMINSSGKIIFGDLPKKPEDKVKRLVADNFKAKDMLKWSPEFDIQSGIKNYSIWMRDRLDFYKE